MASTVTDWYKKLPKHLNPQIRNPNYKSHLIKLPFRMLIIAASGGGKTNFAIELIHRMSKTFDRIVICCKSREEPLYQMLTIKTKGAVEFFENGEVPPLDSFKAFDSSLILFDDLVATKSAQNIIKEYYLRGRKFNVSMSYISQSFYEIPKLVRINSNYIILKKMSSDNDVKLICREFSMGKNAKQVLQLYKEATVDKTNFLMLDIDAPPEQRFRMGFTKIIELPDDWE